MGNKKAKKANQKHINDLLEQAVSDSAYAVTVLNEQELELSATPAKSRHPIQRWLIPILFFGAAIYSSTIDVYQPIAIIAGAVGLRMVQSITYLKPRDQKSTARHLQKRLKTSFAT